ncbi:MAG: phospholipase D-like domain-containing protein [Pseudomonadota bacterium]
MWYENTSSSQLYLGEGKMEGAGFAHGVRRRLVGIPVSLVGIWALFWCAQTAAADLSTSIPVHFSVGPDCSQDLVVSTLKSAKSTVLINAYELRDSLVTDTLVALIRRDVKVLVLVEANPVGLITQTSVKDLQTIQDEMNQHVDPAGRWNRIWLIGAPPKQKGRYSFDHAKYMVIDSNLVFVSSDNFVEPAFPDSGLTGYRGWQVAVEDPILANAVTDIFHEDLDASFGDVQDFKQAKLRVTTKSSRPLAPRKADLSEESGLAAAVTLITSPNTPRPDDGVLGPGGSTDALVKVMQNAHSHLEFEMLSLPLYWQAGGGGKNVSPLVSAVVTAAKAGAQVRVLLNDESVFGMSAEDPPPEMSMIESANRNEATVAYLQHVARCQNLPLHARIVNLAAAGLLVLHNKGLLLDDGLNREYALIGSINGTKGSAMDNREVALLVQSTDASKYYGEAFQRDWNASPEVADSTPCE